MNAATIENATAPASAAVRGMGLRERYDALLNEHGGSGMRLQHVALTAWHELALGMVRTGEASDLYDAEAALNLAGIRFPDVRKLTVQRWEVLRNNDFGAPSTNALKAPRTPGPQRFSWAEGAYVPPKKDAARRPVTAREFLPVWVRLHGYGRVAVEDVHCEIVDLVAPAMNPPEVISPEGVGDIIARTVCPIGVGFGIAFQPVRAGRLDPVTDFEFAAPQGVAMVRGSLPRHRTRDPEMQQWADRIVDLANADLLHGLAATPEHVEIRKVHARRDAVEQVTQEMRTDLGIDPQEARRRVAREGLS